MGTWGRGVGVGGPEDLELNTPTARKEKVDDAKMDLWPTRQSAALIAQSGG